MTFPVPSFEPSSTTITSMSVIVWVSADLTDWPTKAATLKAGTITLTKGDCCSPGSIVSISFEKIGHLTTNKIKTELYAKERFSAAGDR